MLAHHQVVKGQVIGVLEAMKMQNSLLAPRDGVVKAVNYTAGSKVLSDCVIIELVPEEKKEEKKKEERS